MANFVLEEIMKSYPRQLANELFSTSTLLQYLEKKTKSVDRGSKARGSFANLYAIYVLTEDYLQHGYGIEGKNYSQYPGMSFSDALTRTRELPFGEKLQNHALNDRCNDEFKKFFNTVTDQVPIIRNLNTRKYWINEALLLVGTKQSGVINIAQLCINIINRYIELKRENFTSFFDELKLQKENVHNDPERVMDYISSTLDPNTDARIFEIASYVIIKYFYIDHFIDYSIDGGATTRNPLTVYKTGRTNANDGGIDYIMVPLGRIFQVTEVLDFKKYFLDIDKLIYYPITFVVKQDISEEDALQRIRADAQSKYDNETLDRYLNCFEEIITIPKLKGMLSSNIDHGHLSDMVDEFIDQCKVEYNFSE